MNENLNRLSDRINHLENVVTNLTESLPELARQLGSEIRQGICSLLFERRLSFWDAATDGHEFGLCSPPRLNPASPRVVMAQSAQMCFKQIFNRRQYPRPNGGHIS